MVSESESAVRPSNAGHKFPERELDCAGSEERPCQGSEFGLCDAAEE